MEDILRAHSEPSLTDIQGSHFYWKWVPGKLDRMQRFLLTTLQTLQELESRRHVAFVHDPAGLGSRPDTLVSCFVRLDASFATANLTP